MTNYINWMQLSQPIKGDVVTMEGNAVSDYESPATTVASGVAPEGAQYASVWADVAIKVEASNLDENAGFSDKEYALPANTVLQIPNITVGKTTITCTDL